MLLCACAYGVMSEISLDTGDSASNAVVKRSVFINQPCVECAFALSTSCRRAKIQNYYHMWPFAKKLYHGWISTMTSSNKISLKLPPPKLRAGCAPGLHRKLRRTALHQRPKQMFYHELIRPETPQSGLCRSCLCVLRRPADLQVHLRCCGVSLFVHEVCTVRETERIDTFLEKGYKYLPMKAKTKSQTHG